MNKKFYCLSFSLIFLFIFLFPSSGARAAETNFSLIIKNSTPTTTPTSAGPGGGGGGGASAQVCNNSKPGSAATLLSASAGTNSVTLTWLKAVDPVTYYLVAYNTSPGSLRYGNPNVGGHGTTSFTVRGLSGGTTYYFQVKAVNGCMPGNFSNELSATPGGGFITGPAVGFVPAGTEVTTEGKPALFDISIGPAVIAKGIFPLLLMIGGLGVIVFPTGIFIIKYTRYKKRIK